VSSVGKDIVHTGRIDSRKNDVANMANRPVLVVRMKPVYVMPKPESVLEWRALFRFAMVATTILIMIWPGNFRVFLAKLPLKYLNPGH
jgi:hypothetical protein